MRICLVALHFAEYTARLAVALARTHTVQVHLSNENAEMELSTKLRDELRRRAELILYPRPVTRVAPILEGFRLAWTIRRFGADVIHAQEAGERSLFVMLSLLCLLPDRAPFVLTVHDPVAHSGSDHHFRERTRFANSFVRRHADQVIVHGDNAIKDMVAAEPHTATRIASIHHGILGEACVGISDPDPATFLFFGRMQAYKGLGILVDACSLLSERGLHYRVTIAGRGPDLDLYRSKIKSNPFLELDERFIPAEEVPLIFARASVVIMPYLDATQSGVAALAFAAGRPLIASRVGGLPDIVENGKNGLLVCPHDCRALADAMALLITDPALTARLAAGAKRTAAYKLSWDHIAKDTEEVYARSRRDCVSMTQNVPS